MAEEQTRDEEIKAIHKKYAWFYRVLRGAVLIGIGISVGLLIYATPQAREAYMVNVFTSILGLGATALIFDELNRKRSQDELKRQLVDDAASISNEVAKNAVHQLRRKGWLEGEDGLLRGAELSNANLRDAHLGFANLRKAVLSNANLQEADLNDADLREASLGEADLRGAMLSDADLRKASLHLADLQGAKFGGSDLRGAILRGANMQKAVFGDYADLANVDFRGANLEEAAFTGINMRGVQLAGASLRGTDFYNANLARAVLADTSYGRPGFDETTRLPDGNFWHPRSDLQRFIDPEHPNFWRPEWLEEWEAADDPDDAD